MRIVEVREKTVSIASAITNAYIDFSKMTCSVVALITDVARHGKNAFDDKQAHAVLSGERDKLETGC